MIDRNRCMARRDGELLGGARCQESATHDSPYGRRCAHHAKELRRALRDPYVLGNVLSLGRARTEEEIAHVVVELPS